MNNPFDYTPDASCEAAFRKLVVRIDELKTSNRPEDIGLCRELEEGKMLGVLIARDSSGEIRTLYAFSGQVGDGGFHHRDFVEPVFDYLQPDGYFKSKEAEISLQNNEIASFEQGVLADAQRDYACIKERLDEEIADYQSKIRHAKADRQAKRSTSYCSDEDLAEMVRQSQFEKAELRRIKKRAAEMLEPYAGKLRELQIHLEALKERRRNDSEALQTWLFSNFKLMNARGESLSLSDIFAETSLKIPPSGAGECCAPKLLQAAFIRGWEPISIAEYWYGAPKAGELRRHGQHYPACRGKCLPVLRWMLKGLTLDRELDSHSLATDVTPPEIVYENEWFCVVNKPSGILSVPGKGSAISVEQWLSDHYGVTDASDRSIGSIRIHRGSLSQPLAPSPIRSSNHFLQPEG